MTFARLGKTFSSPSLLFYFLLSLLSGAAFGFLSARPVAADELYARIRGTVNGQPFVINADPNELKDNDLRRVTEIIKKHV